MTTSISATPPFPHLLAHLLCGTACAGTASPASGTQPVNELGGDACRQADADGKEEGLVNGICEKDHGHEALVAARSRMRDGGVHLFATGLGWCCVDEADEVVFDFGGHFGDVLRAENVHGGECDGEVEGGEDDVYTQCIPAVGFDEVFETLGDRRIRGKGMGRLGIV